MKRKELIPVILFCFLLFGISSMIFPRNEYSTLENRELEQKPEFTIKKFINGKYQKKCEAYLNDQFWLRDKWVDLAVDIQKAIGKKDINGVYIGKEGYLIEKSETEDLDDNQIAENINTLSSFLNDMAKLYGKNHVSCMMIPSKSEVLTNQLPSFVDASDNTQVLSSIKNKLLYPDIVFDAKNILQQYQDEYIYYRTDHHWTTLGAYYVYQAWAQQTKMANNQPLKNFQQETIYNDFYGTTYNKVHINVPKDNVILFHNAAQNGVHINMDNGEIEADTFYFTKEAEQGFNKYNIFLGKNTFRIEITTKSKTGKTLLLIKDSFANCFVPFLANDYEQIIMIDYRYGKTAIGKILGEYENISDVLVMFNTEKFMQNTKLNKLAQTKKQNQTMKEFNIDDFISPN